MSESSQTSSDQERLLGEQTNNYLGRPSQLGSETRPDLQLAIVEYDDSPDRGTIHPPELTGIERMETWISVDLTVVADLSTWR